MRMTTKATLPPIWTSPKHLSGSAADSLFRLKNLISSDKSLLIIAASPQGVYKRVSGFDT